MDITIITLIVSSIGAVFTGLFGLLGHITKCHSGCCDSDCTESGRKRRLSKNNSSTTLDGSS